MNEIKALGLSWEEWNHWIENSNEAKFRADQITKWLWEKKVFSANSMTNLSKSLRERLSETIDFSLPSLIREDLSKMDNTKKLLWKLQDTCSVESVLLNHKGRVTACVSTQVGCPLACPFCSTGSSGFIRNLSTDEILGQFMAMESLLGREINNLVFMGMGEPLLNHEAVFKSIEILNHPKMRHMGIRHITLSTSGLIPGIMALAQLPHIPRLSVSLHAATDELRDELVPINRTYPLGELQEALKDFQQQTGDRISIGYTLLKGVNDQVEHARALIRYLRGLHVFINLIPYNQATGSYQRSSSEDTLKFRSVLQSAGFEADIRIERGSDIDAACGQLANKYRKTVEVATDNTPSLHNKTIRKSHNKRSDPSYPSVPVSSEKRSASSSVNVKKKQQNVITDQNHGDMIRTATGRSPNPKKYAPKNKRYRKNK